MPKVIFFTNLVSELAQQVICRRASGRYRSYHTICRCLKSQPGIRRRLSDTVSQQSLEEEVLRSARAEACSACQRGFR